MTIKNAVIYPETVTRKSLDAVKWSNHSDHPLQDNTNINIDINTSQTFQTWSGFAGAVSELGNESAS